MSDADELPAEDRARQSDLQKLESAAVPDVVDNSYQAQVAALEEYAQTAFNEVLAQYRFLGLLAGIMGPNDSQEDVDAARAAVMEALEEVLKAGPLAEQVNAGWGSVLQQKQALQKRILEGFRSGGDADGLMSAQVLLDEIVKGHPHDQYEGTLEQIGSGAYRSNYNSRLVDVPPELRGDFSRLMDAQERLAVLEDARRGQRRAAIANFFRRVWDRVTDYYNENMALIRNGQWLLATGRIAVDAAIFAAEEVVVAGIVTAIIGVTGGLVAGMAIVLRSAVRSMLSVVRTGTRVVRNVRASYVFKIELRKVEPGVLYSNPIPFNVTVGRKLDYEKVVDVEKDLTAAERRAVGEGGQGSLEPDADAPESGGGGVNHDDPPTYRHPRHGDAPRSRGELLPNGEIPSDPDFEAWWDDLSPAEHDMLWNGGRGPDARIIRDRVLGNRRTHEWLKRSQLNKLKELGFSMREIRDFTTPTVETHGPDPRVPGTTWRHNPEDGGRGSGVGSGTMHKSLDKIIEGARSRNDLLRRYGYWANAWLHNGIDDLPPAMRRAIVSAGGG